MDLSFTPKEEAFRLEVRAWVDASLPAHLREKADNHDQFDMTEVMEWHGILYSQGWVAPNWPKEWGGAELDATERFILQEELEAAGAPGLSPFGLAMVGPLILRFGTDAQKQRFLPKIASGDEVWCQGYSEPNAGSDLASLQMRADDRGDHFVVNGQKTWTTYAQYADWIFCLVRTDSSGRKQQGISFLLIEMKTPGVDVKPMLTLGHTPAFCETFFEDVKVPKENLLGPSGDGWSLAKALLGHERTLVGGVGPIRRTLRRIKQIAATTEMDGQPLIQDPIWRGRIARLEMRLRAHQMSTYRAVAEQQAGKRPGPETSILKLVGSVLQQEVDELAMDLMGHNALTWFNDTGVVPTEQASMGSTLCYNRATTIFAGSNEIQKNIIAKRILGLPG